jgi:hypothetical protein
MKTECLQSEHSIVWDGKGKRVTLIKSVKFSQEFKEALEGRDLLKFGPRGPEKCELIKN